MRARYEVKITATAQGDFEAIWNHISPSHPLNALRFIEELEEKILSLAAAPERQPVIPEGDLLKTRQYRHLIDKEYRIVYRFDSRTVYILRVFNGAKLLDIADID